MSQPEAVTETPFSLARRAWFLTLYTPTWLWLTTCYGFRSWGRHRVPRSGPVLLASNHQSYFDPMLVGAGLAPHPFHAIARSTLFNNAFFAWMINSLNAIPVRQGESDMSAMRKSIDALKRGRRLMIFPEGSRTPDGEIDEFKPGTMLLIKRARPVIVPVAIEGAYDAWPIHAKKPKPTGRIGIMYGRPISAESLLALPTADALSSLRETIDRMRQEVGRRLGRLPASNGNSSSGLLARR